jgi:hypothetical protein
LPSIGSDHFPIFIEVSMMPYKVHENQKEKKDARPEDEKRANRKIEEAV